MAEYVRRGDAVEGDKCNICTRKEVWKGLRENPITGKPMTVYELDRNCSVEVVESPQLTEEEAECRRQNNIYTNVGDKLMADAITVYINTKKKLKFEVEEGVTGRHGARLLSTKQRTMAVIKTTFENLVKALENKQKQLGNDN